MRHPGIAAVLAVVVAPLACCLVGVGVRWMSLPGGHSRDQECRSNLRSLAFSQAAFRAETGRYSPSVCAIGFQPEYGNRYLYLLDTRGRVPERILPDGGGNEFCRGDDGDGSGIGPDTWRTKETTATLRAKVPEVIAAELGVRGDCDAGACGYSAACVGNIDGDEAVDVWTISTEPTIDWEGTLQPPGSPVRRLNDRVD